MRIAIDASALFGPSDGIGRYASSLIPELIRQGGDETSWELLGRGLLPSSEGNAWASAANLSWRADRLPPQLGRPISLVTSQPLWLNRHPPDLYWGPAHRLSWAIPQQTARVVTIHDLCWRHAADTMRPVTRWLDQWLMPRALMQADRIIAVSHSTARDLLAWQPALEAKVVVVHEAAIALPQDKAGDELNQLGIRSPYLLFVGGLEPRKNLARLIEAFSQVVSRGSQELSLVIVGGHGWGGVDVSQIAERFGVEQAVIALGSVNDRCLAALYRQARCLVMPSLYEGFGLPVLEALSVGTPVVVSDGGALQEVAGPAGLTVDPLSVQSMVDGLILLLEQPGLNDRLRAAAPARAAQFSWTKAARETWQVFEAAREHRRQLLKTQRN